MKKLILPALVLFGLLTASAQATTTNSTGSTWPQAPCPLCRTS